jgi:hypothetical protein
VPRRKLFASDTYGEAMHDLYTRAMHWVNTIDSQDWLLVLVAAVVIGFFMLRGFGSRTNY